MNKCVLYIEDSPIVSQIIKFKLEEMDYVFDHVTNFKDAKQLFTSNSSKYSLVVTDFTFPGGNGVDVVDLVNDVDPHLPVILHSDECRKNISTHFTCHFHKMEINEMCESIKRILK